MLASAIVFAYLPTSNFIREANYPIAHGSPIHIGDPQDIGIHDLAQIHSGGYNRIQEDEIPVFLGLRRHTAIYRYILRN